MATNVRTIRRIGQAKVKEGRDQVVGTTVFEAQWPLVCAHCAYTIQPGEWFTRVPKHRGDVPTEPVCHYCRPFTKVKAGPGALPCPRRPDPMPG